MQSRVFVSNYFTFSVCLSRAARDRDGDSGKIVGKVNLLHRLYFVKQTWKMWSEKRTFIYMLVELLRQEVGRNAIRKSAVFRVFYLLCPLLETAAFHAMHFARLFAWREAKIG